LSVLFIKTKEKERVFYPSLASQVTASHLTPDFSPATIIVKNYHLVILTIVGYFLTITELRPRSISIVESSNIGWRTAENISPRSSIRSRRINMAQNKACYGQLIIDLRRLEHFKQ